MTEEKTLLIVAQNSHVAAMERRSRHYANPCFIATSTQLAERVRARGFVCAVLHEYVGKGDDSESRRVAIEWIDRWAEKAGSGCGATLKEALYMEGASLWWFALPVLFPDVERCIQQVGAFRAAVRQEQPCRIVLVDVRRSKNHPLRLNYDDNVPAKVIAAVCASDGLAVDWVADPFASRLAWAKKCLWAEVKSGLYFTMGHRAISAARRWLARRGRDGTSHCDKTVLLISPPVYWRDSIDERGEPVRDDVVAGNCARELRRRGYRVVGVDVVVNAPNASQFAVLREKMDQEYVEWHCIEEYIARIPRSRRRLRARQYEDLSAPLLEERGTVPALHYEGVELDAIMGHRTRYVLRRSLPQAIDYIGAIEAAVEAEGPQAIIIVYEEGPQGRAATIVGHRSGVPTLALQHGMLAGPYQAGYYYARVSTDLREDGLSCPIPTRTAVYGQHTKSLLTEVSCYPEESVAVVGMPSYDQVVRYLSRSGQAGGSGVESNAYVLVISQPFTSHELRQFYIDLVLDGAAQMSDAEWVVKLHPSDFGRDDDWAIGVRRRGLHNVRTVGGAMDERLRDCGAMVAGTSTAILEAAIYGKPVLAVRLPHHADVERCFGAPIAITVEDSGALADMVRRLRDNEAWKNDVVKNNRRELEHIINRPDGNAAARCAELVAELGALRAGNASDVVPLSSAPGSGAG